jgi:hypothetical protein
LHNVNPALLVRFQTAVPKVAGSMTSSQGICAYIFKMDAFKFTYFFNYRNNVLLQIIFELL